MNIGIVTTWFPAGGGYVSKAYRQLLAKKHDVYIYARQGTKMEGDSVWDDENVYWAKKHYNGIDLKDFKYWIREKKIELLFFNEQRYWKPVILAKKMGVCIGAYIDYYKEDTVNFFSIYDFLICNTRRHYSVFDWHPRCYFIPWGIDLDVFKPRKGTKGDKIKFLISLGWEGQYIGDRKGLMHAIKAFTQVKGECVLLVYSQVKVSECLLPWKSLLESDSRIQFIYGTYDPFPYYEGDVYVYPSRLDGIGLSLPEALGCGIPAITTDNPPMNEFVVNETNGLLVKVESYISRSDGYYWPQSLCNIESLAQAMQRYVDNPGVAKDHGRMAREMAESKMDWQRNYDKLLAIFEDSLSCSKDNRGVIFEDEKYALQLDRKYCPSLTYRFLCLGRDVLNRYGVSLKPHWKIKIS
jgi:glycosyltransferase involved in cell wall biosynthesis